jgi:hypothetical protein
VKWSFSHRATFRRCQRQWYYRYLLANANAGDPLRQEAYRLSKLVAFSAWKGKLVDNIISEEVVPALNRGTLLPFDRIRAVALARFERTRLVRKNTGRSGPIGQETDPFPGFLEDEYGQPIPDEAFQNTWAEIEQSLKTLLANKQLWELLKGFTRLVAQRNLSFKHDGASIIAVPDLIAFYAEQPPLIIDWKVYLNPTQDSWLQLATYAVALTRCNCHRDWPVTSINCTPSQIGLAEVQLITNETRLHRVTSEDVEELEDLISESALEMRLACDGKKGAQLLLEDFPAPYSSKHCQWCPFKKICGGKT